MTDRDFKELLKRYIDGDVAAARTVETMRRQPEMIWQLITTALEEKLSDKQLAFLAAGPLEDLITDYGSDFVEKIEIAARKEPVMRSLLSMVWRGKSKSSAWDRIDALSIRLEIRKG